MNDSISLAHSKRNCKYHNSIRTEISEAVSIRALERAGKPTCSFYFAIKKY